MRWAFEAIAFDGETPRILKRMALIHLLKEEFNAAEMYMNKLSQCLFCKSWLATYKPYLQNPALISENQQLSNLKALMIKDNFLIRGGAERYELEHILDASPTNKMAFEYLIAHDLLSRRISRIQTHLPFLAAFHYQVMPRHVEEVLLLFLSSGQQFEFVKSLKIRRETTERFQNFVQILAKHNNDKASAQTDLYEQFSNTYWYYHLYPKARESL